MSEKINKKFNALCVEMEGASIAQVCYLSHVPFMVIRSISDVPNNNIVWHINKLEKYNGYAVCGNGYEVIADNIDSEDIKL